MPSKWSWVALGAGAYIAFMLALFPAATALRWFAPAQLSLVGVQGTVWSGTAAAGSIGGLGVRDVRWSVRPWALLVGRVSGRLATELDDGFLDTALTATASSVRFSDLRASTTIPMLSAFLPIDGMRGTVSATLAVLDLTDGWPTRAIGEIRLAQLQAEPLIPIPNVSLIPLGDYEVRLTETDGEGIAAQFVDAGGPLEVAGSLRLDAERRYALDSLVKPRPGAPQPLLDGLAVMTSEPDAEGRRRLMMTGSL